MSAPVRVAGREKLSKAQVEDLAKRLNKIMKAEAKWTTLIRAEAELFRVLPLSSGPGVANELRTTMMDAVREYEKSLSERFTISFAGASKMGKSSLVNALVGLRLLHFQNDVDTMGVTFIQWAPKGSTPKLYVADKRGNPTSNEPIAEGEVAVFTKIGELHAEIKRRYDFDPEAAMGEHEFLGEFLVIVTPMLLADGLPKELREEFQLVDTPGPDKAGNNSRVSGVAWEQNANAHLTVALVTARDSGTTRAQEVFQMYSVVRESSGRTLYPYIRDDVALNPLFVAVTNFDGVSKNEAARVLDQVSTHISGFLKPQGKKELPLCKDRIIPCIPRDKVWVNRVENGEQLDQADLANLLDVCFGVESDGKTIADLGTGEGKRKLEFLKARSNVDTLVKKLHDFIITKSYPSIVSKQSAIVSSANEYALNLASKSASLCKVIEDCIAQHAAVRQVFGQPGKALFKQLQDRLVEVAVRVEAGSLEFTEEAELMVYLANKYQTSVSENNGSFGAISAADALMISAKAKAVQEAIISLFELDTASITARMAAMKVA